MKRKALAVLFVMFAVAAVAFAQSIVEVSDSAAEQEMDIVVDMPVETAQLDRTTLENPQTLVEKFSYVLGYCVGPDYFYLYQYYYYPEADEYFGMLGAYDAELGLGLYTDDEMSLIIAEYEEDFARRVNEIASVNLETAESFLEANAQQEGVFTTESGLQYMIIEQGTGALPQRTDTVELDYQLSLLDGTIVDSSYLRGEHASFPLDGVIEGFAEGVCLMPLGSHYMFFIHPSLGYGESYMSEMAPNSLLIFEVQTYSIVTE